jgi:hypothetical protein
MSLKHQESMFKMRDRIKSVEMNISHEALPVIDINVDKVVKALEKIDVKMSSVLELLSLLIANTSNILISGGDLSKISEDKLKIKGTSQYIPDLDMNNVSSRIKKTSEKVTFEDFSSKIESLDNIKDL